MNDLKTLAYHEAGHAALALCFNQPIEFVTTEPGKGYDGAMMRSSRVHEFSSEITAQIGKENLKMEFATRESIIAMAGHCAEEIFLNKKIPLNHDSNKDDIKNIMDLIIIKVIPEINKPIFLNRIREETRRLLIERWPMVEVIANNLLQHRTLNSEKLNLIVGQFLVSRL